MVIENKIDYKQVLMMIKEGIFAVMDNDEMGKYSELNVVIANEQFYIKAKEEEKLAANTIYMVVKFSSAAVDYGVTVLPLTIVAISEQNHCDLCQSLLQDFTTMVNMETNDTETIQQFYDSPVVTSNFNEMYEGFRSVLSVSGTFVISESSNPFTLEWFNPTTAKYEEVHFINGNLGANFQPDPKLFYDSNNYIRSIDTMGTITFNISALLLSDEGFYDEMLKFITQKNYNNSYIDLNPANTDTYLTRIFDNQQLENPKADINKNIVFKLTFKNGQSLEDIFKIGNIDIQQVLKKIPMITLTFSN